MCRLHPYGTMTAAGLQGFINSPVAKALDGKAPSKLPIFSKLCKTIQIPAVAIISLSWVVQGPVSNADLIKMQEFL